MHMNADVPTGSIGNIQLADTFLRSHLRDDRRPRSGETTTMMWYAGDAHANPVPRRAFANYCGAPAVIATRK